MYRHKWYGISVKGGRKKCVCTFKRLLTYICKDGHYKMQGREGKVWQALTDDIHSQKKHSSKWREHREGNQGTVGQSVLLRHTHPIPPYPPYLGSTPSFPSISLHGPASLFCPQGISYLQITSLPLKFWSWELGGRASHKASSYATDMQCHVLHSPLVHEGTGIIASPQTWSACHYPVDHEGSTSNMEGQ